MEGLNASERGFSRLFQFFVHTIQDLAHFEGQAVGLVNAANLIRTVPRPQKRGQLAVAVKAFVVDLRHEDVVEPFEDLADTGLKRLDVADV